MNYLELDNHLRDLVNSLLAQGYKQTNIGRLLLGTNGYAPMSKFLSPSSNHNFGIKPLTKIGNLLGYNLKLVYTDPNTDSEINNVVEKKNKEFFQKLQQELVTFLNENKVLTVGQRSSKKSSLDTVLDSLLED